ncbi:MAG: cyclic pyranopterin monophosphate synthase MoaC [Bacilli bacterium]
MSGEHSESGQDITHLDRQGRARMVDISAKEASGRAARARADVRMRPATLARIREGAIAKGDVLAVAQVAAIMGAKRTADVIPLCHPLALTGIDVEFSYIDAEVLRIEVRVRTIGQTGVEMEALTGCAAGALTVYDMCKAIDRSMTIESVALMEKSGGKSGPYRRQGSSDNPN